METSPHPSPRGFSRRAGAGLALAVIGSHLPFLAPGYGTDSDTWKFASAIREMAETGRYTASRFPGYPLMEMISAPFQSFGPWVPNLLSAVAAGACAWLVARLLARHGVRDAWLGGAAFAFVPAAFLAGDSSIDYLWALAFVLASWLDASDGRPARAGLWLGLAIGTRLTSAVFALPIAILLRDAGGSRSMRRALVSFGVAGAIGAAWYVPAILRYGWGIFSYSEITGGQASALKFLGGMVHPESGGIALPMVAGQATVVLWGVAGSLAIGLVLLSLLRQRREAERAATLAGAERWAAIAAVALVVLLYVRLPHDEGYLLPMVPFVLLALATWVTPPRFRALCAGLLLSPFVLGVDIDPPKRGATPPAGFGPVWRVPVSGETVVLEALRGPALRDHAKRVEMARLESRMREWWPSRPEHFVVVAGNTRAMLYHLFPQMPYDRPFLRDLSPRQCADSLAAGVAVYALPDAFHRMSSASAGVPPAGVTLLAATGDAR